MKSGLKKTRRDWRDYDYLKTKKFGGVLPNLPASYNVDAKLWTPNQETGSDLFNPHVPPMPYGCTNYTQTDLCIDEDGRLYNPWYLESITHANESGGTDLRTSLEAVVNNGMEDVGGVLVKGQHQAYFNVKAQGGIDWFTAVQLAMFSTSDERRAVSVGTPWYPSFFPDRSGIVAAPNDWTAHGATWHNWAIKGWKSINGVTYLIGKPWLGADYGDEGFGYFSREIFNALMNIRGTCAFTIDKLLEGEEAKKVDMNIVDTIVSFIRNLFHV